jgi:hypothetical protein
MSRSLGPVALAAATAAFAVGAFTVSAAPPPASPAWNKAAAAAYLDGRAEWWLHWQPAARDHDTACVSCHTTLPYALARPALRTSMGTPEPAAPEQGIVAHVDTRVRLWNEVEPFYPDQTRGLPKTSESRGTEAVLNAVVLASRDNAAGTLGDDTRRAFENMWALQFKNGDLKGAWAWLNFHYEPWESADATYFGAALAAIAVGTAPGYASSAGAAEHIGPLADYLRAHVKAEPLVNQAMALWAASMLRGAAAASSPASSPVLASEDRDAIVEAVFSKQQDDGGWSTSALGDWKRVDGTELDRRSDGYATGLVVLALERAGVSRSDARLARGLAWLTSHQDASGMWAAISQNKQRDPASDAGKFMSDAATAYAVLALTER